AAAAAAVAAVRSALGHELLAAEAHGAVPALAGVNFDLRFVDELHLLLGPGNKKALSAIDRAFRRGRTRQAGTMMTTWRFSAPLWPKDTVPLILANSVWSLPMPTLSPAWIRVPR